MARKGILIGIAALAASSAFAVLRTRQAEKENPPLGNFVEVDGVRLHYIEQGSGEPLVLLHGNGSLIQDFLTSGLVRLATQKYRVIVFDRPGYGWSERPRNQAWTPAAQADLLHAATHRLGAERSHVFGHSWGTLIAVEWALRHPESVASLTLASGYFYPTRRLDVALLSAPAVPVLGDVLRFAVTPILGRVVWRRILRTLFDPAPIPKHFNKVPRGFVLSPLSIRASAEESKMMISSAAKLQSLYGQLEIPVSIIAGDGDQVVDTDAQSERLHEALPASRLRILSDVGHMVHHSEPQRVMDLISSNSERICLTGAVKEAKR